MRTGLGICLLLAGPWVCADSAADDPARPAPTEAQLRTFAEESIERAQALQRRLVVYDEVKRSNRDFELVALLDDPPRHVEPETWVLAAVCATPRGKRFVLDFWVVRDGGSFRLGRTRIRGKQGRPRYRWVPGNPYWQLEE